MGQPRKTRPCLTEELLMGRKESNQTNNRQDCKTKRNAYQNKDHHAQNPYKQWEVRKTYWVQEA